MEVSTGTVPFGNVFSTSLLAGVIRLLSPWEPAGELRWLYMAYCLADIIVISEPEYISPWHHLTHLNRPVAEFWKWGFTTPFGHYTSELVDLVQLCLFVKLHCLFCQIMNAIAMQLLLVGSSGGYTVDTIALSHHFKRVCLAVKGVHKKSGG